MRRCQNCLAPWRYVCTVTVTCSLPEQVLGTIVVSCLKKEISGFVYIQSVKIFAPCMYRAIGLRTLHVRTLKSVSDSVDASGMFSLTAEKIASYPSDISKLSF